MVVILEGEIEQEMARTFAESFRDVTQPSVLRHFETFQFRGRFLKVKCFRSKIMKTKKKKKPKMERNDVTFCPGGKKKKNYQRTNFAAAIFFFLYTAEVNAVASIFKNFEIIISLTIIFFFLPAI